MVLQLLQQQKGSRNTLTFWLADLALLVDDLAETAVAGSIGLVFLRSDFAFLQIWNLLAKVAGLAVLSCNLDFKFDFNLDEAPLPFFSLASPKIKLFAIFLFIAGQPAAYSSTMSLQTM